MIFKMTTSGYAAAQTVFSRPPGALVTAKVRTAGCVCKPDTTPSNTDRFCQPVGSFLSSAFLYEMSVVTAEEDDREFEQRRSVRRFRFLALEAQAQFYRVTAR